MPLVPKRLMLRRSERVRARSTCKAESRGHCHQIGERVSLHLSHHLTSVCLYCDLADVELATDLFIQQAGGYQGHDLPFARRERRVTVPERPYLRLATKCGLTALDGASDSTQQHIIAEWLRQEFDSARLHGLDGHRYVTVTRNEDDRHVDPIAGDAFLQIETIETWKRNVEYEAARNKDSWAAEKFLCGREYFRCQPSQRINNSSDSRTETSSSTTNTIGVASDMGVDPTSWPSARAKFILYPPGAAHTRSPNSLEVRH